MRVAVTSSAGSARRMSMALEGRGHDPVVLPCIAIEPGDGAVLEDVRQRAARADLVVITSPTTVETVWPQGSMPSTPVAVVGPATAVAVEAGGGRVTVVGDAGGQALADLLVAQVDGRRVVLPQARSASPHLARRLRSLGAYLSQAFVYDTRPIPPADGEVDGGLFCSPSAVAGWLLSRTLDELPMVGAIGLTTAGALTERGRTPDFVPIRPSIPGLVAGIDHLRERTNF